MGLPLRVEPSRAPEPVPATELRATVHLRFRIAPDPAAARRDAETADIDLRAAAVRGLSAALLRTHGAITDAQLELARLSGLTDAEIVEVIAGTATRILSGYLDNVAGAGVIATVAEPADEWGAS
ncbi:hypothetical protein ABZ319_38555 [Nocardia sp. NPDC005978]|uniref:hypothetical protein n=1 Tax=Nocardia sp. NPDC005978 TaxID=3156725 RepID=UPI0033A5425E